MDYPCQCSCDCPHTVSPPGKTCSVCEAGLHAKLDWRKDQSVALELERSELGRIVNRLTRVLESVCGWNPVDRMDLHDTLARYAKETPRVIFEYRFCGEFGSGGKLKHEDRGRGFYVTMYPEDRTPNREAAAKAASERLKEIVLPAEVDEA